MLIKNVLAYCWGSSLEPSLIKQLTDLGIWVTKLSETIQDYHADSKFAMKMMETIHQKQVDAVFSFDYFPVISMICEINQIPYFSWIYDCPMLTLQSKTLENDMNYIYCFDRIYTEHLLREGAKHCFHMPLGGNADLLQQIEQQENEDPTLITRYGCDISFLGNLYNEKKNRYRSTTGYSDYTKGFLEGAINAQLQIYGYNFMKEILPDNMIEEIESKCQLKLGEMYRQDARQLVADAVNMEVSARERELVLKKISSRYPLTLYTGSKLPDALMTVNIKNMGYADYEKEMPYIFHNSKINLNITSKSIESGIPLRVFDILSCGGFYLTNYQPEIAEMFEDGVDLVTYTDMDDLMWKVAYYLAHEEERVAIAKQGYQKLTAQHDVKDRIMKMLSDA